MDSDQKNKQLKNEGIDWISEMPDSILHKILSYLPTKNAVGTCILSKRWKNLFPIFVPPFAKLDLDDSLLLRPRENIHNSVASNFITFVDRLLNDMLVHGHPVDSMILKCTNSYGDAKITSWVSSTPQLKLRELKLMVYLDDSKSLFQSISGCSTLVRLEISHRFALRVSHDLTFFLPNIKELCLANLIFDDEEYGDGSIDRLLHGCRSLVDLCIRNCEFGYTEVLYIGSDVLKKLTIQDNDTKCEVHILAPNLETLFYSDFTATTYDISKFLSPLKAHIDLRPNQRVNDEIIEEDGDELEIDLFISIRVVEIVTACSTAVRLYVSAPSIAALNNSFLELPKFENLIWLSLGCIGGDKWKVLAYLLHKAPNLEKLTLEEGFSEPSGGYAIFEFHTPQRPLCFEQKLKEIDYWCFKKEDDEIKLLEYFLYQGHRLEIVKLHWLPYEELRNSSELLMLLRNCDCHTTKIENGMQISFRGKD